MSQRTLLCFGDSNTHGSMPMASFGDQARHAPEHRWPSVLQARLGAAWTVVDEGQPGRTTVHDDPVEGAHKSGLRALPMLLESHRPVDLLVIMLGTNDLKARFGVSAFEIAQGVEVLVRLARASACGPQRGAPAILVVAPTPIVECEPLGDLFRGGRSISLKLADAFAAMGERAHVRVMDAGPIAQVSRIDGIHFEAPGLQAIGTAIADQVTQMTT